MASRIVPIEKAIDDLQKGKMIILVDNEARENEGDLCCAAEHITPDIINFMAMNGRGLICLALTKDKAESLNLNPMVQKNTSSFSTAFTASIDASHGVTTGISAYDRATTIRTALRDGAKPSDLVTPGHVFPLRAREGGVFVRSGQTEGSTDLARLAGLQPAAVICEIMKDDGSMARIPDLQQFAMEHDINIVKISDLISYRIRHERVLENIGRTKIAPWTNEECDVSIYRSTLTPDTIYVCLSKGKISQDDNISVEVYKDGTIHKLICWLSGKVPDDFFTAHRMFSIEQKGVLVYLLKNWDYNNNTGPKPEKVPIYTDVFNADIIRNCVIQKIVSELGLSRYSKIKNSGQRYEYNREIWDYNP